MKSKGAYNLQLDDFSVKLHRSNFLWGKEQSLESKHVR